MYVFRARLFFVLLLPGLKLPQSRKRHGRFCQMTEGEISSRDGMGGGGGGKNSRAIMKGTVGRNVLSFCPQIDFNPVVYLTSLILI